MQVRATYLCTTQRNRYDGQSECLVVPQEWSPSPPAPYSSNHRLPCVGRIQPYLAGMPVVFTGQWDGKQFIVETDCFDTQTRGGIDTMLDWASGMHLGGNLTPCQIDHITDVCNGDLFDFFCSDDCTAVLMEICKHTSNHERMVLNLVKLMRQLAQQQELVKTLLHYKIPYDNIKKMLRKSISLEEIRENPYLIMAQYDVPIPLVDAFARYECGYHEYDRPRCLGFVYAAIRYLVSRGNSCCTMEELMETINTRYEKYLDGVHFGVVLINACIMDLGDLCKYHTIGNKTYIYLNENWECESNIIRHIHRLQNARKKFNTTVSADDTAAEIGITYNAGQRSAFDLLRTSGVKILTGPPGSGKTAAIKGLIHNFEANGNGIVHLAATTGMAARVMRTATDRHTETAHTMLRVMPMGKAIYGRDLNDPVDADLIIVDEISMIGVQLFSILVGAARSGAIVLLVGDENQLQSVDYGNVLHDLISSGEIEVCRLTEILRQSGTICANAAKVNDGDPRLEQDNAFKVVPISNDTIHQLVAADYAPTTSQIITPLKGGPMGTDALNRMIQAHVNGNSPVVAVYKEREFRLNDKIIMLKNNYDRGYINGDIGFIRKLYSNGDLLVAFSTGTLCIMRDDFRDMALAYAITIHKSQGSEFPLVHIVLPRDGRCMMTRRLIYTAITRAKQQVIIYTQGSSLQDAIADHASNPRTTMLQARLQNKMK